MTLKSLLAVTLFSLTLVACSSEATTSTTGAATTPTTVEQETSTTMPEQSTTTTTATTVAPTTTTTAVVPAVLELEIEYQSGVVDGGGRIEVPLGEAVVIRITSDVADEVHLHGYDIYVDVEPGVAGVIELAADIPGIFELELENSRVLLADLEVAP